MRFSDQIEVLKEGLVDDGIYGYKLKSPYSFIRYGFEPSSGTFYLYNVSTPKNEDQNKGYATELLENLFQIIEQKNGALDAGPYTTSGTMYIKHIIEERLVKKYKIKVI